MANGELFQDEYKTTENDLTAALMLQEKLRTTRNVCQN